MAKPIAIAILANGSQASKTFDSLGSKAAKWGKRMAAVGAVAAVAIGKQVVDAGSNAQQSLGATEQIYGKYADTVIKRSNQAAKAIGLSANEYRELSNVTGAMLKSSGMPLAKVADLTDKLNKRAADMAATFGGTTREAVEAVSSLLRGEADPIERYGVSIKQSDVNARLAAKGLDKLTGSAKKTAEQQARLDLLFGQSKDSAGQFARESNTLAGQQQRLAAQVENVKARIGTMLLPMFTKAAAYANKKLVPALEGLAGWLEDNSDEIAAFGKGIGRHALPPLKTLGEMAAKVAKWLADLPGPVKEIGIQAGIAALILPRLTAAASAAGAMFVTTTARVKQFGAELTYLETRQQRVQAGLGRLAGAAKAAAGIGGMVALTEGAKQSDKAMGTLMTTVGGAATGFAVGGPWGAAIGGAAGLLGGLWQQTKNTSDGFENARPPASDYASTLDGISGAAGKATRELVLLDLQQQGAIGSARTLGISQRDLVGYVMGNDAAWARISARLAEVREEGDKNRASIDGQAQALTPATLAAQNLSEALDIQTAKLAADQKAKRASALATEKLSTVFKGVPKKVITRLEQTGFEPTRKQLARLTRLYDLTPKQLRTIIKATDAETSAKKVQKYNDRLKETGKTKPSGQWEKHYRGMLTAAESTTTKTGRALNSGLTTSTTSAKTLARVGAAGIGNDLKTGLPAGFAGADLLWSGSVRNAVAAAIAAGRREAQSKSPSRKTMALGRDLADGLVIGMARRQAKAKKGGKDLVAAALTGVTDGTKGVDKALNKATKLIERRIKGKGQEKREKATIKRLRDEYKALQKNGKLQDKINAKLTKATQLVAERVQAARDHVATIRASVLAYGSITALEEGHLNSPTSLVTQMEARVKASERFATLITQLTGKLNKTSLQELIDKGVDGGLAAAEALAAGGKATIDQVNALQARLSSVATQLGATAVAQFHQVGIDAAQGVVDGLTKQAAKLDKAAKKLAKLLVKAIKKELGIKSPSRVGKDLGKNFAGSLDLGAKVIPLDRTGRRLARDLVTGFGEPTLSARAAWEATRNAQAAQQPITVDINLTADQLSSVEQGRRVVAHVNAYRRAGGAA